MIINSPLNWQVHYDYARAGLGQDTGSTDPLTNISTGFSTATSGWGMGEWAIVLIGGYALFSMVLTTRRGLRKARRTGSRRRTQTRRQLAEGSL